MSLIVWKWQSDEKHITIRNDAGLSVIQSDRWERWPLTSLHNNLWLLWQSFQRSTFIIATFKSHWMNLNNDESAPWPPLLSQTDVIYFSIRSEWWSWCVLRQHLWASAQNMNHCSIYNPNIFLFLDLEAFRLNFFGQQYSEVFGTLMCGLKYSFTEVCVLLISVTHIFIPTQHNTTPSDSLQLYTKHAIPRFTYNLKSTRHIC